MIVTEREREAETQAERSRLHAPGADVGIDPGSPESRPGPKAGAKPLRHPGIPHIYFKIEQFQVEKERKGYYSVGWLAISKFWRHGVDFSPVLFKDHKEG